MSYDGSLLENIKFVNYPLFSGHEKYGKFHPLSIFNFGVIALLTSSMYKLINLINTAKKAVGAVKEINDATVCKK